MIWGSGEEGCPFSLENQKKTLGTLKSNDADGDENVKKTIGFINQNNSFARASHFFCTFLSRFCTTTT